MLTVSVITPQALVYEGTATEVVVPTADGILGIRAGHQPLISPLKEGLVVIKDEKGSNAFRVEGGFLEVQASEIRILADAAEAA